VIGPAFTPQSIKRAHQYKARTNGDIALVTAEGRKHPGKRDLRPLRFVLGVTCHRGRPDVSAEQPLLHRVNSQADCSSRVSAQTPLG
jgi:hypothetical protein